MGTTGIHAVKLLEMDIYRESYANTALADIWDKITAIIDDAGVPGAELIGLQITEWIRSNWGGSTLVERHNGDARTVSRFNDLRHAMAEMAGIDAVTAEIVRIIRADYLGVYIPSVKRLNLLQRDYAIWLHGNTPAAMEQLARANDISVVRAYQINKTMQKQRDRREQPGLF
jgi:hypothetical protein